MVDENGDDRGWLLEDWVEVEEYATPLVVTPLRRLGSQHVSV